MQVEIVRDEKKILPAFLLCLLTGGLALHRFYVGKVKSGFVQLTLCQIIPLGSLISAAIVPPLGFFCSILAIPSAIAGYIWVLIDLVLIIIGKFKDVYGQVLKNWT